MDRATSFLGVLRELDVRAMDTLYGHFQEARLLAAARLTCPALRRAIDSSVREARINIRAGMPEQASPLARFPRLTSIRVELLQDEEGDGEEEQTGDDLASFMAMPFVGLPPASLDNVNRLKIVVGEDIEPPTPLLSNLLPILTARLPGLRHLHLSHCYWPCWPEDGSSQQQTQLMDAIAAACPRLEMLTLPAVSTLQGTSALAGSLRRLEIKSAAWSDHDEIHIDQQAVAALSQLSQLRELHLSHCGGENGDAECDLHLLLDALPTSVVQVTIACGRYGEDCLPYDTVVLARRDGVITSVRVKGDLTGVYPVSIHELQCLAALLQACNRRAPALLLFRVERLILHSGREVALALGNLRCACVEVGCICIPSPDPAAVQSLGSTVSVLGLPERVELCGMEVRTVRLGEAAVERRSNGMAVTRAGALKPQLPVPISDVLAAAVKRVISTDSSGGGGAGGNGAGRGIVGGGGVGGAGGVGAGSISTSGSSAVASVGAGGAGSECVLLHGPSIAALLGGSVPDPVTSWLHTLAAQAGAGWVGGGGGWGGDGSGSCGGVSSTGVGGHVRITSYLDLSASAAAVLVRCVSGSAASALVAAAAAVGDTCLQAAVLEKRPASKTTAVERDLLSDRHGWKSLLRRYLQQVLQELWDCWAGCGLSEGEQLKRLAEVAAEVDAVLGTCVKVEHQES